MNAYRLPTPPDDSEEKREIADFQYAMGDDQDPRFFVAASSFIWFGCAFVFLGIELTTGLEPLLRISALIVLSGFEWDRCKRRVVHDRPAFDVRAVMFIVCTVCNLPAVVVAHEPAWLYAVRATTFGLYYSVIATYYVVRWRAKGSLAAAVSTRP